MGHIKNLFEKCKLPPRNVTPIGIWADVCENIHLHFRNYRLEFSEKEWAKFRAAVHFLGMGVEKVLGEDHPDWEPGDYDFLMQVMYNETFSPHSKYHANRLTVEEQRDGTFHVHYRDLRLHLSHTEFMQLAKGMKEALERHEAGDIPEFPYKDIIEATNVTVDIGLIQPYDAGHLPMEENPEHREGIEYAKELLKQGKRLRPILVDEEGQRLDGYKRYMAQKELGCKTIECIVDPNGIMGGQHGMSMDEGGSNGDSNRSQTSAESFSYVQQVRA